MTKKSNRLLAMMLVIAMCFTFIGVAPVESNAISYSGSSSYMSGKYYTALTNVTLTGSQRTDILNVAKSQVGYLEGDNSSQHAGTYAGAGNYTEYGQWYSNNIASGLNGQAWCAMFVSWCANVAGISSDTVLYHSYTETQQNFFEDKGQSYTRATVAAGGYTPQPGDIIFFCSESGLSNGRDVNHVGIVSGYSNGVVYTVEGNTSTTEFTVNGGCVANKSYSISDTKIRYICSPSYTGGSASGDTGSTKSVSSISELSADVGVTNKLKADISGSITIEGDTYVIDLAGHKWTNSGTAITLATGLIYVYDSVGGGSIVTSTSDAVNMGNGTAKFEDITITAGGEGMDAIYCSGGNLTVINCTLSAPKAAINVANDSEAYEAAARSVVTVDGGKFANYSGTKDSQGRNCAIEIRNNADEITLKGDITFENNIIISKTTNTKSIKDAITANATYTAGNNVADYVTATINYGSSDSGNTGDGGNTGDSGNTDSTNEISSLSALSGVEGVVNKLTANVDGGIRLEGETYVIDLAGHKWTNSETAITLATGSIYVYDSVGGGSIVTSKSDAVGMGNGTAKFENITIIGGGDGMDAIFCDGGNLTVINCTLSAPKAGINVSNGSEAADSSARSVVTVDGGKFANYTGTKDSQGRNCAIEIRNNADEITLTGNITFENNKIISKKANTKSIKDSITTNGTFTSGSDVSDYVTATISFGGSSSGDSGNTDSDVVPGDMNGDTIVNAKDVTAHRRYLSEGWELTINMDLIDVNNDGNVNAKDVTELRRFISEGWEIELVIPGNGGNTENPGDNENPGDSGNTGDNDNPGSNGSAVVESEIDISKLSTSGTFTEAGFDASQKLLNFQSGGENSSTSHSIGIIDLSKYKEIIVTFSNDGTLSGKEVATVVLKTGSTDLTSAVFTGSNGWDSSSTATFDVSSLNNNEELFMALASANGGFAVTKIELVPINGSTGDSGNTNPDPDSGNTGDNDNPGSNGSAVVGSKIDISKLSTSGTFTEAGFDASQKLLNFQSGGENSSTSHSIGIIDLSKYKEIIVTFSNDGTLSGKEVATVVLKTGSTDLTSAVFTGSNGWDSSSTATFDVSSFNNNEELFMALASANGGFVVTKIELVPINGNTGDSGNTNPDSGNTNPDSGNTGTVTNGEINISSLSNAGTFTAAGYGSDVKVLNMATGGSNDSLKHSIGTHDLSKYNMLKVTYGTASGISSVGTLNLKDSSGNVIASVTLKPAGGWKATTAAELDISKSSYNGALTLELTNQSNGAVITKLVLSSAKADSSINISSLATSGAFTAGGYSNKILNFFTGGTNDAGSHSIGSHNLAGYNVLKVTYGTDPSVSTAGTLKLKDASGNVIASVSAPGSAGWKETRTVELDISKSTYNGALKLELADAKGGMAVTAVTLSADKADSDLTIKNLSTSGTFTQSGMSADKYVLNFYTGGQNDSGKHSIGTHSLDGYNSIFITYSTGAVSSIGTLQLTDASGNVISSVKLSPSGGWLLNSKAKIDVSGSTYSGELYLKASSDVTNGFAISAITFSSKDTIAQSGSIGDIIIQNAQLVSDFARTHGFVYGHATYNPGMNWASLNINSPAFSGERITSCDRFVDWVLYRSGFTQGQKKTNGHVVFEMEAWLKSIGFTKITDVSKLQKGDIIFTIVDKTRPSNTPIPAHVFICASSNLGGNVYLRYDHGSNARIQCVQGSEVTPGKQPFREVISEFVYAYRPCELG